MYTHRIEDENYINHYKLYKIMKMKIYYALTCVGLAGVLSSCSNEKEMDFPPEDYTIRLYISGVETRTTNGDINKISVHSGNTIGAYGVSAEGTITNGANNKYTIGSDGNLKADGNEMMASERTQGLKIFAYAPHNEEWNDHNESHLFTVSQDQSEVSGYLASDLLYADGVTIQNVTVEQSEVELTFNHKMSRIELNIELDEDAADLSNAKVIVNNTKPSIDFKPTDGTLGSEASGDPKDIIAVNQLGVATNNAYKVYAIVVPQEVEAGNQLFTIDRTLSKYTLTLSKAVKFEEGKNYTFTVNIKPTTPEDIEITLDSSTNVEDWGNGNDNGNQNGEDDDDDDGNYETYSIIKNSGLTFFNKNNMSWTAATKLITWSGNDVSDSYLRFWANEDIPNYYPDLKKYKSLVIEISDLKLAEFATSAYLVIGDSKDSLFKASDGEPVKVDKNGVTAIDLTQYGNEEIVESAGLLGIFARATYTSNSASSNSVKLVDLYLTTQKAASIK